ncbi:MAG: proline iminopeptidase [Rhodospirillales bacterium]|nr:proline iminopeptidase [Rhodospirillales bacterium]
MSRHPVFDTRPPDAVAEVTLRDGHKIATYRFGPAPLADRPVLLLLNGGPGLPCDYLRDSHAHLASDGLTVIAYDQLGCGASSRPVNASLWTLDRYVDELDQIVAALGLGRMHLLGHSWGTWLGTEYCLTYPHRIRSYVCTDGACDIPHLVSELNRLRNALGSETVAMMLRFEAENRLEHPAYKAAVTLLNYRHVCRLDTWPDALNRSIGDWNMGPYVTMQGPNEFTYTGNMKDWNRIDAMRAITAPSLVLVGQHDELTPACSMKIHHALPNSRIKVFPNSSHMPFFEEPDSYFETLCGFLAAH